MWRGGENIAHVISEGKADAVAIASILHYDFIRVANIEAGQAKEGNVEFLKSGKSYSKIETANLIKIKEYLQKNGFACRYTEN